MVVQFSLVLLCTFFLHKFGIGLNQKAPLSNHFVTKFELFLRCYSKPLSSTSLVHLGFIIFNQTLIVVLIDVIHLSRSSSAYRRTVVRCSSRQTSSWSTQPRTRRTSTLTTLAVTVGSCSAVWTSWVATRVSADPASRKDFSENTSFSALFSEFSQLFYYYDFPSGVPASCYHFPNWLNKTGIIGVLENLEFQGQSRKPNIVFAVLEIQGFVLKFSPLFRNSVFVF